MKKKETQQNNNINNGIAICDSIVMSVKKKRVNLRRPEAIIIAVIGYVSVIMAFFGMFHFHYDRSIVANAAVVFSGIYILLSLTGKKSGWLVSATAVLGAYIIYRQADDIINGFQYVYNVIYRDSFHTEINYYKHLESTLEKQCVTAFFVAVEWLLALFIYYFTIAHPNPILPLLVTFPIIEVGLYNGIELPVFWGVLVIAYWLALLAMSNIDMGEYSGGTGGFVRKDNLFFPKRQMRLKVTEKCGMLVAAVVIITGMLSSAYLKASDYRRSDEINRKRADIRDAVNSFSMDNIASSISDITKAFGFTFNYPNHKLGNIDHMKYKNTVDLTASFEHAYDGAVYLKEYTGSVYENNSWNDLPDDTVNCELFDSFESYGIHPQDYPYLLSINGFVANNEVLFYSSSSGYFDTKTDGENIVLINSKLRSDRSFAPYGTSNDPGLSYVLDKEVSSKQFEDPNYSYTFCPISAEKLIYSGTSFETLIKRKKIFIEEDAYFDDSNSLIPVVYTDNHYISAISNEEFEKKIFDYATDHGLLDENGDLPLDSINPFQINSMCEDPEQLMAVMMEKTYRDFVYENYLTVPEGEDIDEIREEFKDCLKSSKELIDSKNTIETLNNIRDAISSRVQYTLSPGKTPQNRDFVNYFLLENKKGYCTHYATAGVLLARMAGIPARYATGYLVVGNDFNDNTKNENGTYTIDIKDNRSHAWTEVYLDGIGWLPFEFTAGYSQMSIDTNPAAPTQAETSTSTAAETTTTTTTASSRDTVSHESTEKVSENKPVTSPTIRTTTVQTTAASDIPGSSGEGGHKHLPAFLRAIFDLILLSALITGVVYLRRRILNYIRDRRMTTGSSTSRIAYMYGYMEKLLAVKGIKRGSLSYADFADELENRLLGYIPEGDFVSMTEIALRSAFSHEHPTEEELTHIRDNIKAVSDKIYMRSGRARRFWLKYIKAIL